MKSIKVPIRYVPKILTRKDKKKQSRMLKKSRRDYKKGKYYTRKKVKSYDSKESQHIKTAKIIYNVENMSIFELAKKTSCKPSALNKIVKKGQGAYFSSGSRPNQTAHSWGIARLASSITGGKAAAVDYNILEKGCSKNSKALKLAKKSRKKHGFGNKATRKTKI